MTGLVSPLEQFYLAARGAVLGRRLRDPVLLLAAAKIATRLGAPARAVVDVSTVSKGVGQGPADATYDARPLIAVLRSDARVMAYGSSDEALIDMLDAEIADLPGGESRLVALSATLEPGKGIEWTGSIAGGVIVAGDGRASLRCQRGALTDEDATGSLAFLVATGAVGAGTVRVDNAGRFPSDVLCVWARA